MSLAAAATRFNAITDSIRSMMTASSSADVTIEGIAVPSLRKQIATETGTFLLAKTSEINAASRLAATYAQSANSALANVMNAKSDVSELSELIQFQHQQVKQHATTVGSLAAMTAMATADIDIKYDDVVRKTAQVLFAERNVNAKAATVIAAESVSSNALQRIILEKTIIADAAVQTKRDAQQTQTHAATVASLAALTTAATVSIDDKHEEVIQKTSQALFAERNVNAKAATVVAAEAAVTNVLNRVQADKALIVQAAQTVRSDAQQTVANAATVNANTALTALVVNDAMHVANVAQQTARDVLATGAAVRNAQIQVGITYNGVTELNKSLQQRDSAAAISSRLIELKSKAVETLSALNVLLHDEMSDITTDAQNAVGAAAHHAVVADQYRQSILHHRDAISTIADEMRQLKQTLVVLTADVSTQIQLDLTSMSDQLQRAQQAAAQAVHVAFDTTPLQEQPAPGKAPIAGGDAQIAEQWLNCESAYSTFVITFAGIMNDLLNLKTRDDSHSKALSDFIYRTDRAIAQMDKHLEKVRQSNSLPEELFQGFHAAGKTHRLPVFNMMERDFLAEAAQEEGYAEFLRSQGASGIVNTRQYQADRTFELGYRVHDVSYAALNIHNHPNYKSQPGMAEIAACINGYYFRTRHMDYAMAYPIKGQYLERVALHAPEIPASIAALPTGINSDGTINFTNTQAGYMRDVKTANPQDCQWHLAYLECWLEQSEDDALADPAESFRHANDAVGYRDMFEKGRYLNASGHKNRLENLSYQPFTVRYVDAQGVPRFGTLQYRINSYPVGDLRALGGAEQSPRFVVGNSNSHYHTLEVVLSSAQMTSITAGTPLDVTTSNDFGHVHQVRISWDGMSYQAVDLHPGHQHPVAVISDATGRLPYNEAKAVAGTIDNTNRFKLIRDLRSRAHSSSWAALAKSRMARFECVDLIALCEKLPGLEGDGAFLEESYTQYGLNDVLDAHNGTGRLNAARYNRRYKFNRGDASGRVTANRGFNDPTLFVAKTSHPRVVGGFSWMIPLELILRTPRENWNPYNLPTGDYTRLKAEETAGNGTQAKPFSGIHSLHFYYGTPVGVVPEVAGQVDPADTANTAWVKDANGIARQVLGNGIRVHDVDGVRQRYPIYPLFSDHGYSQTQQHWLRKTLTDLLKKVAAGTLTVADIDNNL